MSIKNLTVNCISVFGAFFRKVQGEARKITFRYDFDGSVALKLLSICGVDKLYNMDYNVLCIIVINMG